jgi:hypothetical protein
MRRRLAAVCSVVLALATGCGNERTPTPDVTTPGPPLGSSRRDVPQAGVSFLVPSGWRVDAGAPPLLQTISTGRASIAIWRYPRTEPLPRTGAQLTSAADALVAAAKARDPSFTELHRSLSRVGGHPAVQLHGTETVAGQPRTVRSTHVYAGGGEVVVDAFAPEQDFKRVDDLVFRPLVRSLRVRKPR